MKFFQFPNVRTLCIASFFASSAQGAMRLTLSGSNSQSNAGYQKIESGAGSASLSLDLGEYFRVGYSHRQELSSTTGYHIKSTSDQYTYFKSRSHITSNGVDLTLVLYNGEVITPFVFLGVTQKHYVVSTTEDDGTTDTMDLTQPGPEGGVGLGIRLSEKFSLKLTYTMSTGSSQLPGYAAQGATDTYTQLGLSYAL
jgi:Outer membrane protein beta-barrel domain